MGKMIVAAITIALEKFVLKLLTALGLGFASYKGLDLIVKNSLNQIEPLLRGLPADVINILSLSGFFEALSIICSAYLTAIMLTAAKTFLTRAK